ncbi:MAG: enoyl-CoA hydratase/isomerase family protein [Rhizobium sp.]|nr:enoyl-CoA hydratase/isomerase family protein [Rhizobium sp.]MBX9459741.1 enoyl-CoA hydratase/isomerase family protein [Rhizobium sp.]
MTGAMKLPQAWGVAECRVKRVAVIGAGAMGGGIAAQFANAGVPVDLLDVASDGPDRSSAARAGIARQLKTNGFTHEAAASLVRPRNMDTDLDRLADADWIVEAIIENVDLKRALYARIDRVRKPGSIVSSNTSTILRADLLAGAAAGFAADFVITHFFNPPRVMRLVELVAGQDNNAGTIEAVREACETILGKKVVDCGDTPGFIANRIGCHWLAVSVIEAQRLGVTIEEADTVIAALGIPRTGAFGLMDLIGIDLVPHVWASLQDTLPASDAAHDYDLTQDSLIRGMIGRGQLGRKTKSGFYRLAADRSREVLDFTTADYRPERALAPRDLPGGGRDLSTLLDADGRLAIYARRVFARLLSYAARHVGEIAVSPADLDTAMVLGYGWRDGPFAIAARHGVGKSTALLAAEGEAIVLPTQRAPGPEEADGGHATLTTIRARGQRMAGNDAASLWDGGDGIAVLEVHTKMNALSPSVFDVIESTLELGDAKRLRALVIANEDARAFSAGADLSFFLSLAESGRFDELERFLERGQELYMALKYAPFPVVAAVHGLALGGGSEMMMHADAVVAHIEMNAGLPETKVGIIPGWGGSKELLLRMGSRGARGPVAPAAEAFQTILGARISRSAHEALALGLLRPDDVIVMNRDHLLSAARHKACALLDVGYRPPEPAMLRLAGPSGRLALMAEAHRRARSGQFKADDIEIADVAATVLTGGANADPARPLTEHDVLAIERAAVLSRARHPETLARMRTTLKGGR